MYVHVEYGMLGLFPTLKNLHKKLLLSGSHLTNACNVIVYLVHLGSPMTFVKGSTPTSWW